MAGPARIEGLAIVSADGMIADRTGQQPPELRLEADQRHFCAMLDAATVLVHGRNSNEGGTDAARRRRIVMTRRIERFAPDPDNAKAMFWNPANVPLELVWDALGLSGGILMVIGGTSPYATFLEYGYDAFHLSHAHNVRLEGGVPVFPGIPPHTPEQLLSQHGLRPGPSRVLDESAELSLTTWQKIKNRQNAQIFP
jgi:dihydrofolate reductase